jgi:hypothetical protein
MRGTGVDMDADPTSTGVRREAALPGILTRLAYPKESGSVEAAGGFLIV